MAGQLTVAELVARMRADMRDFVQGVRSADQSLDELTDGARRTSNAFDGVKAAATVTAGVLATQFAQGVTKAVKVGTQFNSLLETTTLQFQTLFKDGRDAGEHVAKLFEFAKFTPFETEPILRASRMLETFGGAALNNEEMLTRVGDAAAGATVDFGELSVWIGRAYSSIQSGRPFGEAAMRLQELAVLTPQARQEIEQMQKSGADASEVFDRLMEDIDRFGGAMAKQAQTWDGLTSTIDDALGLGYADMTAGGFEAAKEGLKGIVEILESDAWMTATRLISDVFTSISRTAVDALLKVKDVIVELDAEQITTWFNDLKGVIGPLIPMIITFAGHLGIGALVQALPFLGNILPEVTRNFGMFGGVIASILLATPEGREALMDLVIVLADLAKEILPPLVAALKVFVTELSVPLATALQAVLPLVELLADLIAVMPDGVLVAAAAWVAFNKAVGALPTAAEGATGVMGKLSGSLQGKGGYVALALAASEATKALWTNLDRLVSGSPDTGTWLSDLQEFGATGEIVGGAANMLGKDLGRLETMFSNLANKAWTDDIPLFNWVAAAISPGHGGRLSSLEELKRIDDELVALHAQDPEAASDAFNRMAAVAGQAGVDNERLLGHWTGYARVLDSAAVAAGKAARETEELAAAEAEAAAEAMTHAEAVEEVIKVLSLRREEIARSVSPVFNFHKALGDAEEAAKAYSEALASGDETAIDEALQVTTDAALALHAAFEGLAGGDAREASAQLTALMSSLQTQLGLTDEEMAEFISRFSTLASEAHEAGRAFENEFGGAVDIFDAIDGGVQRILDSLSHLTGREWEVAVRANWTKIDNETIPDPDDDPPPPPPPPPGGIGDINDLPPEVRQQLSMGGSRRGGDINVNVYYPTGDTTEAAIQQEFRKQLFLNEF